MKLSKALFAILFLTAQISQAAILTGQLQNLNAQFALKTHQGLFKINFPERDKEAIQSLIGKARFVEVEVKESANGELVADRIPTMVSGERVLTGTMTSRMNAAGKPEYEVNGIPVDFDKAKLVNGSSFDEQSIEYYVGKKINARANIQNGVYIIQSIMRADILSASPEPIIDPEIPKTTAEGFFKNPGAFVTKLLKSKKAISSPGWFKGTMFSDPTKSVQPNDYAMIITSSGREGDSPGAVNGHFAVGIGQVGPDMQLKGEIFNFYVINEKEIIPGDVELTDYFGHLISGQSNYRPTFTLVMYGVSPEKMLSVRDELDRFHSTFRTTKRKITADINCASMSLQALADVNIYGVQRNENPERFSRLSEMKELPPKISFLKTILFLLKTKRAEFMPGPAQVSLIENLPYLNEHEHLNLKRVDFILGGQTPSSRPSGGEPTSGIFNEFMEQAIVEAGLLKAKIEAKVKASTKGSAESCKDNFSL